MPLQKLQDLVIYRDEAWYSTFPSLITREDGTVLCAFRRAPDRRRWGGGVAHADPNSWCMAVSSSDNGRRFAPEPTVVFANPVAGNQDPCLFLLRDGTILCSTFSWMLLPADRAGEPNVLHAGMGWAMCNVGCSLVRSGDGGQTWSGPYGFDAPPPGAPPQRLSNVPNRGACRGKMTQLPDGRVLWPLYSFSGPGEPAESCVYASDDGGTTWRFQSEIARHESIEFNETSLQLCPSGKIVAWMRTANLDGYLALAHSTDGGETWSAWRQTSVWGHPFTSCNIPDGRVVLIYGYRREPFGVRVKLLDPECGDVEDAEELVLRTDGGNYDLGYPWVTPLADGNVLCAYYINHDDGTRYIAGSIVAVR